MVRGTKRAELPIPHRRRRDRAGDRRPAARALIAAAACLAAAPALAIDGTVQDAAGHPLADARVCYVDGDRIERCVETDPQGRFEMPDMHLDELWIAADGFLPSTVSTAELDRPIVLDPSPSLLVRLVDARSGEPIDRGQVYVVYPTGREVGPFPVNRAGVRVTRVVAPGKARVRVEAPGYASGRPREIELVGGEETEVELKLEPAPPGNAPD
jgi:hypothetical protein